MPTREVTLRFEVPEVYRLVLDTDEDGTIRAARAEGEFVSRQIGRLVSARYRDPHKAIYVVERLCGACSHAHTLAFSSAVESALSLEVPRRAQAVRVVFAELERIQSHLYALSETATAAASGEAARAAWSAWREVTGVLELLSANRVHYGVNCIGGVTRDLLASQVAAAQRAMHPLAISLRGLRATFEASLGRRLAGLGRWRGSFLPGTGPNQRASGSPRDVRSERPYLLYSEVPWRVCVREEGDCLSRVLVRLDEIVESHAMALHILGGLPPGEIRVERESPLPTAAAGAASVEAPRGEDRHDVELTPDGEVERFSIRVPTEDLLGGASAALEGVHEADARVVIASFDLCMSCFGGT